MVCGLCRPTHRSLSRAYDATFDLQLRADSVRSYRVKEFTTHFLFGAAEKSAALFFSGGPSPCVLFTKLQRFSRRTHLPFVPLEVSSTHAISGQCRIGFIRSRARIAAASARCTPRLAGTASRALMTPGLPLLTGACRALVASAK